jgi:hypothetical protein
MKQRLEIIKTFVNCRFTNVFVFAILYIFAIENRQVFLDSEIQKGVYGIQI